MGFFMDGLDAEAYDRTYTDRALVRRVLGYFRPQARRMVVVAMVIVAQSLVDISLPIIISRSLDDLQAGRGNLALIALAIVGLGSLSWVFNFVRRSRSAQAVGNVVLQLRA